MPRSVGQSGITMSQWRAKNMQNLGQFYTTSDWDREYLRNETRYQKSKRYVISNDSSRVQPDKSSELWSTIPAPTGWCSVYRDE